MLGSEIHSQPEDNKDPLNCQEFYNPSSLHENNVYHLQGDDTFEPDRLGSGYKAVFAQFRSKKVKTLEKHLLGDRIKNTITDYEDDGFSYLEHNALTRGDLEYEYKKNISKTCGCNAIWLQGIETNSKYVKQIECRKQWCPVCGGKGGNVHSSRMHSLLSRINPELYNLRQFVFTIPQSLRHAVSNREGLNYLIKSTKQTIEKFFGEPVFDALGHVKKYKLNKGVISYLHVFGETAGIFKPHINIHIIEEKNVILKLSPSILESIKKYWLKKLKKLDGSLDVADVHYSFRNTPKRVGHALKYMCRPWSAADLDSAPENIQKMLVMDMTGFQYLRYWGALSNCRYKDEIKPSEQAEEKESLIKEELIPLFIAPFDLKSWENKLEKIEDGFYRLKEKVTKNEEKTIQEYLEKKGIIWSAINSG